MKRLAKIGLLAVISLIFSCTLCFAAPDDDSNSGGSASQGPNEDRWERLTVTDTRTGKESVLLDTMPPTENLVDPEIADKIEMPEAPWPENHIVTVEDTRTGGTVQFGEPPVNLTEPKQEIEVKTEQYPVTSVVNSNDGGQK